MTATALTEEWLVSIPIALRSNPHRVHGEKLAALHGAAGLHVFEVAASIAAEDSERRHSAQDITAAEEIHLLATFREGGRRAACLQLRGEARLSRR